MMKRLMLMIALLVLTTSAAQATILPATGVDEDFAAWTGIECTPAVILCENLTVYDARGDQGGQMVNSLSYTGQTIPVIESWDGYARIYHSDGNETGWVHNEYLLMDPAWYVCDEGTQVYAYPDGMAPRVAWLDKGTKLPILTEYEGDAINGWVCVSLRGAAGWIRKTPADTASETWFSPDMLAQIETAHLQLGGSGMFTRQAEVIDALRTMLTSAEDRGGAVAGCPFDAQLTLTLTDGTKVELQLATDSCCIYRVNGRDYAYARHLKTEPDSSVDNQVLYDLFDMNPLRDLYGVGE